MACFRFQQSRSGNGRPPGDGDLRSALGRGGWALSVATQHASAGVTVDDTVEGIIEDMDADEWIEDQENEVEALRAIFNEDFENLHYPEMPFTFHFQLHIVPHLGRPDMNFVECNLVVGFPERYPQAPRRLLAGPPVRQLTHLSVVCLYPRCACTRR